MAKFTHTTGSQVIKAAPRLGKKIYDFQVRTTGVL